MTIVAVATGRPDGGLAVLRLSGPDCRSIAGALFDDLPAPRRLSLRALRSGATTEHALVAWMPGPTSFTGEDVLELHVHAGERNVRAVLEACLAAGAAPASAGAFSRRAFENGRLTLDQAEGVAALIGAQTDEALAQARRLVAGEVGRDVAARREATADLRAEIEANLDFPEDVDPADIERWRAQAAQIAGRVDAWLAGFDAGRRGRERPRVVLAGPPNAGKSALFNALLGHARAIVAESPGTTRDFVDGTLEGEGFTVTLVDTAGLRDAPGGIEREGIARTQDQLDGADLVLWVEPADAAPLPNPPTLDRVVRIETKRDLGTNRPGWVGSTIGADGTDVAAVLDAIRRWATADRDQAWIGLVRHRDCAADALSALRRATELLATGAPLELPAFELSVADARLAQITGRAALGPMAEELLARIFSRFCIGK